jgi:hypothetical protein
MKWRKLRPCNREAVPAPEYASFMNNHITAKPISSPFRASSIESGECVWAATASLVHAMNATDGLRMIILHTQFPDKFQWLSLYSDKSSRRKRKYSSEKEKQKPSVAGLIQENTNYQIMKIPFHQTHGDNLSFMKKAEKG